MPGVCADGQDVSAVYEVTLEAAARARRGEGPTLIEARTYRFDEHNVGLIVPGAPYRTQDEIDYYKAQRDPITLFRQVLISGGHAEAALSAIENEVTAEVQEAVRFAEESPLPDVATLYDFLSGESQPRRVPQPPQPR